MKRGVCQCGVEMLLDGGKGETLPKEASLGTISGRHFFWEHLSPPPQALLPYTKKKKGLLENGT
jgi:hypothetical protein